MKTLSDDIIIYVSGFNITTSGLYNYQVYKGSNNTNNIIFTGQLFLDAGSNEAEVDVTEILRNYKPTNSKFFGTIGSSYIEYENLNSINSIVADVNVCIILPLDTYFGTAQTVGFFYTNPVKIADYPVDDWVIPSSETATYPYSEGVERRPNSTWLNGKMIVSHYPWKSTMNYGVSTLLASGNATSLVLHYGKRIGRDENKTISLDSKRLAKSYISLTNLYENCYDRGIQYGKEGVITIDDNDTKFCIVDFCPAPYYLKWQDRYGSWNSYGFSGNSTYKEEFSREESTDWKGVTRPLSTTIKSSWSLSSGWVKESDVPHFESIFISPYLSLYDTERDTLLDVIIRDTTFEEKTYYNNGKKMISLSFNVELSKQQTVLT